MNRILEFLARHAMTAMASGVFIGLLVPPLAALLNPLLAPAVWLLLVISLLRVDAADSLAHARRPLRLAALLIWSLVVTPMVMFGLLAWSPLPSGVAGAMVLAAGSSPLISTPALGLMMGLDGALILVILLGATLLVPLTLPSVALVLLGIEMEVSALELMGRLGGLIGSALLVAFACRRIWGAAAFRQISGQLDGSAVFLLIVFAVAIMDGLTARLLAEPGFVLFVVFLSFAVYVGLIILTALTLALLVPSWGRRVVLSVGFAAGCRNLAIILAVLPAGVDPDMILYFAAGQFPIYIMPAVLRPIMLRLLGNKTISGSMPDEGPEE